MAEKFFYFSNMFVNFLPIHIVSRGDGFQAAVGCSGPYFHHYQFFSPNNAQCFCLQYLHIESQLLVHCDGLFIFVGQNLNNSSLLMHFDVYENKTSFLN